jgi:hypothetical protein
MIVRCEDIINTKRNMREENHSEMGRYMKEEEGSENLIY